MISPFLVGVLAVAIEDLSPLAEAANDLGEALAWIVAIESDLILVFFFGFPSVWEGATVVLRKFSPLGLHALRHSHHQSDGLGLDVLLDHAQPEDFLKLFGQVPNAGLNGWWGLEVDNGNVAIFRVWCATAAPSATTGTHFLVAFGIVGLNSIRSVHCVNAAMGY